MATLEISREADVTVANLNVLLHRARLKLRDCLTTNWFEQRPIPC